MASLTSGNQDDASALVKELGRSGDLYSNITDLGKKVKLGTDVEKKTNVLDAKSFGEMKKLTQSLDRLRVALDKGLKAQQSPKRGAIPRGPTAEVHAPRGGQGRDASAFGRQLALQNFLRARGYRASLGAPGPGEDKGVFSREKLGQVHQRLMRQAEPKRPKPILEHQVYGVSPKRLEQIGKLTRHHTGQNAGVGPDKRAQNEARRQALIESQMSKEERAKFRRLPKSQKPAEGRRVYEELRRKSQAHLPPGEQAALATPAAKGTARTKQLAQERKLIVDYRREQIAQQRAAKQAAKQAARQTAREAPYHPDVVRGMIADRSRARAAGQRHRYQQRYLEAEDAESPEGRRQGMDRHRMNQQVRKATMRKRVADAQTKAEHAETRAGKRDFRQQHEMNTRSAHARARVRYAQTQAKVEHAGTPAGRKEYKARDDLRKKQDAAEEQLERSKNIAVHGPVLGRIMNMNRTKNTARTGVSRMDQLKTAFGRLQVASGVAGRAKDVMKSVGTAANPMAGDTWDQSWEVLKAKIGRATGAARFMDRTSSAMQNWGKLFSGEYRFKSPWDILEFTPVASTKNMKRSLPVLSEHMGDVGRPMSIEDYAMSTGYEGAKYSELELEKIRINLEDILKVIRGGGAAGLGLPWDSTRR